MRILFLCVAFCFLFGCKKADIVYQKPFGQWAFVGYLQANQIDLANPSKPSFKMNLDLTETPLPLGQTTKYVFVGKGELNEFGGEYEIVPTNDKQGSFKSSNFYATNRPGTVQLEGFESIFFSRLKELNRYEMKNTAQLLIYIGFKGEAMVFQRR